MTFDDVAEGARLWLSMFGVVDVPCTVLEVAREDDGVVSEVMVRREDDARVLVGKLIHSHRPGGGIAWRTRSGYHFATLTTEPMAVVK